MPAHLLEISQHLSHEEIHRRFRSCKNIHERERWHALSLLTNPNQPTTPEKVAAAIGRTPDSIRKIVHRYNRQGPEGLTDHRKAHSGRKLILNDQQRSELVERLKKEPEDGGLWTAPKVAAWVKQKTGTKVSHVTGWQYLQRLGFSLRVPRPRHSDAATPAEQTVWKKNHRSHNLTAHHPAS